MALYGTFTIGAGLTFCYSTDDPFITMRYAANLVHGYGPVYNAGQHVEGFTSPLHLLLVTVAYLVPFGHDYLKVKLISLLFAVLTLMAARRLFSALDLPPWARTTGLILTGSSWSLAVVAGNGLETTVACWLTTLLVSGLVRGDAGRRPVFMGVCAAGLAAVRPEGIAVALLLALVALVAERRVTPWWRRAAWFAGAVAAEALIEIFRLAYYRQLLPNTYYAKRGELGTDIHAGLTYLTALLPGVPTVVKTCVFALGLVGTIALALARDRRGWYVIGAVVAQVAFIIESGGDWMVGDRFFAPVVPMAAVLVTFGVVRVISFSRRLLGARHKDIHLVLCGIVAALLAGSVVMPFVKHHDPVWSSHGRFDDASLVSASGDEPYSAIWAIGPEELRCVPSGSWVAYSEIGYAGFERLDVRFLDPRGLTDTTIARDAPASIKNSVGVTDYDPFSPTSVVGSQILAIRPVVVVTFDVGLSPPHRVLGGAYQLKKVLIFPEHPEGDLALAVYQRTDPPTPAHVLSCGRAA